MSPDFVIELLPQLQQEVLPQLSMLIWSAAFIYSSD